MQIGFELVITAAIDAAAPEDIAGVPVRPQQQHWDAVNLPSKHARPQAAVVHLPIPHPALPHHIDKPQDLPELIAQRSCATKTASPDMHASEKRVNGSASVCLALLQTCVSAGLGATCLGTVKVALMVQVFDLVFWK